MFRVHRLLRGAVLRAALVITLLAARQSSAQTATISGQVRYYSGGGPVAGVSVQINGPAPSATVTDANGQYAFTGLASGTWTVTPQKVGDLQGGLSALDASFVLQATVGLRTFTPAQQLAGDVTANGTVSAFDASRILQFTVGLLPRLPAADLCASDWLFIPVPAAAVKQQRTSPTLGGGTCELGAITFAPLAGDAVNQDFLAVLMGDCTGNWPGTPTATPTVTPTQSFTWPQISLTPVASGFASPVHATHAGDGSRRLFVVEKGGVIRIVQGGTVLSTPFLNISSKISTSGERGLLSVAFPSGYATSGRFYVYYNNLAGNIVIARYRVSANPNVADPNTEEIVITVPHPGADNHNGGQLAFSPIDGFLYAGTGDGGGGGDPGNNGQNTTVLLGKILRLNVEQPTPTGTPTPYAIPTTNPVIPTPGARREIWAWGVRNPWRFAFDRLTGDLYVGDVGQGAWEEVDFQAAASPGGENYGWRIMEGAHCFNPNPCDPTGLTLPVWEYDHSLGCAITGGVIYRGTTYPRMHGTYFAGDSCSGRIWGLRRDSGNWYSTELLDTALSIVSFGEDEAGDAYVVALGGSVYRIVDTVVATPTPTPPGAAAGGPSTGTRQFDSQPGGTPGPTGSAEQP